jgi:hypothetical protein
MADIKAAPIARAIRVIESCKTAEQLKVAEKYTELALKASVSNAYGIVITYAEKYFDILTDLHKLIAQKNKFLCIF